MLPELGIIEEVDPRKIWPNEAKDFTPWLKENIGQLAQVLGIDLEITESEGSVGSFAVDLVGNDLSSGNIVIIENQLESTDHTHLGQLFTYAAGREAKIIIWISPSFREEHRRALDWLNENTPEDISFFGIEIRVAKIGNSKPAPLFKLVSQPNHWQKSIKSKLGTPSPRGEAYQNFWAGYLQKLKSKEPSITKANKVFPNNWFNIAAGRSGFAYSCSFASNNQITAQLYIDTGDKEKNKQAYEVLFQQKEAIEQELGIQLTWERMDDRKASRISFYTTGNIEDTSELDSYQNWMVNKVIQLNKVFNKKIKQLQV